MSARLPILLIATLLGAVACRDRPGPADFAGAYALDLVGESMLPAVILSSESATMRLIADTLRLRADGTGSTASVWEMENPPDAPVRSFLSSPLRFVVIGDRAEIEFICPINALCAEPPHRIARFSGQGLRVDDMLSDVDPYFYLRFSDIP